MRLALRALPVRVMPLVVMVTPLPADPTITCWPSVSTLNSATLDESWTMKALTELVGVETVKPIPLVVLTLTTGLPLEFWIAKAVAELAFDVLIKTLLPLLSTLKTALPLEFWILKAVLEPVV